MAKRQGMILSELLLYLFLGSLLLVLSLRLFQVAWLSFQSSRRMRDVANDFIQVSERLKYDLLGDIESITFGDQDLTFSFLQFAENNLDYQERDYTLMLVKGRLIYNIWNKSGYTANYLSSLVRGFCFQVEGELLIMDFDYGDYVFRRCFRLDHIKTKRFLHGSLHPDPDQPQSVLGRIVPAHRVESVPQRHLLF